MLCEKNLFSIKGKWRKQRSSQDIMGSHFVILIWYLPLEWKPWTKHMKNCTKVISSVDVTQFSPDPPDERQAMIIDVMYMRRGEQEEGERREREGPSKTWDWSYWKAWERPQWTPQYKRNTLSCHPQKRWQFTCFKGNKDSFLHRARF